MDWLKKNFEKLILVLMAVALLATSVFLVFRVAGFRKSFGDISAAAPKSPTVRPVETDRVEAAREMAKSPALWKSPHPLFVSRPYLAQEGRLVDVQEDDGIKIHPPVPNEWFLKNDLDILDTGILRRDTDEDGFSNRDEWVGKTDPQDPEDHPAYYTKLRLEEYIEKQFRLLFASYSGDTFQINTIDVNQPSQFLKLGDQVKGTEYKIVKFEEKFIPNPDTGGEKNVSELTLRHNSTEKEIILQIEKIVNDPDSLAKLRDLWAGMTLEVKKDEDFVLKAEPEISYKLISVTPQEAVIKQNDTGKEITIPKLES